MPEQPESEEEYMSWPKCDMCGVAKPHRELKSISRCCCRDDSVCKDCLTTTTLVQYLKKCP